MTTQTNQPVEKTEVEKQQSPEQIQSKATDRTLAQAVVEARDTSRPLPASAQQRTDSGSVATAARPTYASMAENSLDVHLNGTDILRPVSHIAEENFARQNVGSSSFEARQYVVQANMSDSRPAVETVKLNAGGQEYQGFRYMNPESGKEYFYANDPQHAGQRFEFTKSDTGYTGIRQLGGDGENKTIPIMREPSPAAAFRGDGELGGHRTADAGVQFRPQPMAAPEGQRSPQSPAAERPQPSAQGERMQGAPAAPDKPVSINPQLLGQIKTQLEANPKMVDELQRQAEKDWRAAAILKELGYQRPEGTANGGAQRPDQVRPEQQPARAQEAVQKAQEKVTEPVQKAPEPVQKAIEPVQKEAERPALQPAERIHEPAVQPQPTRPTQPDAVRPAQSQQRAEQAPKVTPVDQVVRTAQNDPLRAQHPTREQTEAQPKTVSPLTRPTDQPQIKPVETVLQGKAQMDVARAKPDVATTHDAVAPSPTSRPPQTLETLVATRLNDATSRQAAVDALQLAQKGKVPVEGDAQQTMRLQQLVQNIGPSAFGRLQTMIQDQANTNAPLRLDGKFDPVTAARLRDFLDLTLGGTTRSIVADRTTLTLATNAANRPLDAASLIARNFGDQQSTSNVAKDFVAIGGAAVGGA
ncbi:MAG TPA: hypothetical protein V6D22_14790 [Candidatus Obscuribacterales bacterium]